MSLYNSLVLAEKSTECPSKNISYSFAKYSSEVLCLHNHLPCLHSRTQGQKSLNYQKHGHAYKSIYYINYFGLD